MKSSEPEIRRHADGSIDTEYYIRHCHRERSLAAHRAIARLGGMVRAVVGKLRARGQGASHCRDREIPDSRMGTAGADETIRRAA